MPASGPLEWLSKPPRILVVGDDSCARAIALILDAGRVTPECLDGQVVVSDEGGAPQILHDLQRVILVGGGSRSSADLLNWHEAVWRWIERLSPEGDQHEIAVLFILADASLNSLGAALAVGLGLQTIDPATSGHGIARMSDPLHSICTALAAIKPMDLPPLRARKRADVRHAALHALRAAGTSDELRVLAHRVAEAFQGHEYLLDIFCRPPGHRNGNLFRAWLRGAVSEAINFEKIDDVKSSLATWLRDG
jgi:hypothetical protein